MYGVSFGIPAKAASFDQDVWDEAYPITDATQQDRRISDASEHEASIFGSDKDKISKSDLCNILHDVGGRAPAVLTQEIDTIAKRQLLFLGLGVIIMAIPILFYHLPHYGDGLTMKEFLLKSPWLYVEIGGLAILSLSSIYYMIQAVRYHHSDLEDLQLESYLLPGVDEKLNLLKSHNCALIFLAALRDKKKVGKDARLERLNYRVGVHVSKLVDFAKVRIKFTTFQEALGVPKDAAQLAGQVAKIEETINDIIKEQN